MPQSPASLVTEQNPAFVTAARLCCAHTAAASFWRLSEWLPTDKQRWPVVFLPRFHRFCRYSTELFSWLNVRPDPTLRDYDALTELIKQQSCFFFSFSECLGMFTPFWLTLPTCAQPRCIIPFFKNSFELSLQRAEMFTFRKWFLYSGAPTEKERYSHIKSYIVYMFIWSPGPQTHLCIDNNRKGIYLNHFCKGKKRFSRQRDFITLSEHVESFCYF